MAHGPHLPLPASASLFDWCASQSGTCVVYGADPGVDGREATWGATSS